MPKRKNPIPIYPNLETAIIQKGILKKDIAAEIGINARTLSSKLIGEKGFWLSEALWTIVNKVDKQKSKIYRKFTSA